jgi:hypothetical protein
MAIATVLGIGAIVAGLAELRAGRLPLLQRNRETPQRWLHRGPIQWAILNGLALGTAFTTRLGFALWYAVPCGALLAARPGLGAAVYGAYGCARTSGALGLIALTRIRGGDLATTTDWMRALHPRVRRCVAAVLVAVGVATVSVAGL